MKNEVFRQTIHILFKWINPIPLKILYTYFNSHWPSNIELAQNEIDSFEIIWIYFKKTSIKIQSFIQKLLWKFMVAGVLNFNHCHFRSLHTSIIQTITVTPATNVFFSCSLFYLTKHKYSYPKCSLGILVLNEIIEQNLTD